MKAALDGYLARLKNEHRTAMYVAWHQAAFQRSSKMPPLAKVLGQAKKRAQSPAEMLSVMRSLTGKRSEDI